tara:strand:+ start:166 stop:486 length:321 start_codon:yes stop_codon:yes gene_type:complete
MEIKTVEMQEEGSFLVNKGIGQYFVPDDMDNRHRVMVQEWIDAGNTPTPFVGPTDMELWKKKMAMSDGPLPRWAEDILDGMPNKLSVAKITLDRLQAKKDLRATKP